MIPLLFYRISLLTHYERFSQRARKMTPLIVLLLIFVYSIKTVTRNTIWRDEHHFWLNTVRHEPLSAFAHNNLGIVYANEGRYSEAIQAFEKSLSFNDDNHALIPQCNHTKVYNNLGRTYYTMLEESLLSIDSGAFDESAVPMDVDRERLYHNSFHYYQKALQLSFDNAEVHNNLGDLHYLMHSYQAAAQEYRTALKLNPSYAEAYNNLGVIYLDNKRYADAEKEFVQALEVKPYFFEARSNVALVYMNGGQYQKALKELQEVVRIAPYNAEVHFNLAVLYVRGFKNRHKGSYHLNESLRLKPLQSRAKAIQDDLARLASAENLEN
jgi:tetratricopeptide (TPR) repeat protein